VVVTSAGSIAFNSVINAGSGIIDLDANSDGVGVQSVTVGGAAEFTTTNAGADAIHFQVNNSGVGTGDEGDITVTTVGGKFTAGNGGTITLSTLSGSTVGDARMTFGDGTAGRSLTFDAGVDGKVVLASEDYILVNAGMTLNVTGGSTLAINANQDNAGLESVIMYAGAGLVLDGAIVSDSTKADAVTINVGTTTGSSILYDISVGTGGGISVNHLGGTSSISVAASGVVSAPGAGTVAITSPGTVDVSGTIDAGTGLIDIDANTDNTGIQAFTMGADGRLTTDSAAANSVTITVGTSTGGNTVREIDTLGGVVIDVEGEGTTTFSNATISGNGIIATGAGNVTINTQGAAAFNGSINAGSGTIDIDANSDGAGAQSVTVGGAAAFTTTNATASAIHLQVNVPGGGTGDDGDLTVNTTGGSFTAGNGGTITLSTLSGTTSGTGSWMDFGDATAGRSVTFNAGANGAIVLQSEDYVLVRQGMTVNVTGGSTLAINANQDNLGLESVIMYAGIGPVLDGAIVSDSTKSDAVTINVGTTTGSSILYDISVGTGGGISVNQLGGTSSISVGSTGLISAPGAGTVAITSPGTVDVSGTIDAGTGLIDIDANTDTTGNQVFTMGVNGLLTTNSTAANSVSVSVGTSTGDNTVREIDTMGGVVIDINGEGAIASVTFSNATTSGNGITANGTVSINAEGGAAFNGIINAGSGIIDIDANSDGAGAQSLTVGGAAAFTTTNATASAIHLQVNNPGVGTGDEGDLTVNTTGGSFTAGNGGTITLSTLSGSTSGVDARMDFGNAINVRSVTFNAGATGSVVLESEDYVLIRQGMTLNVTGSSLTINANEDDAGIETVIMYAATGLLSDAAIVSTSTSANAVSINVGTNSGTGEIYDVAVGTGGGISVNVSGGNSAINVGAGGLVSAPGTGSVAISSQGSVGVNGTIDAGAGLIDIDANTDTTGNQVFTMGVNGLLTTNSTAANSVSVSVGTSTGDNTVREIDTLGGVVIDINGEGAIASVTFSNATISGNGITANGTVSINAEGGSAFNGIINAGSGIIDIDANSDGAGAQSLTVGGAAAFTTTNATASAIHLQVNNPGVGTGDEGDLAVNTTGGSFTAGNGGTITLSSISGYSGAGDSRITFGDGVNGRGVTFNAGASGQVVMTAEDYFLIREGMTVNMAGGSKLTVNANDDDAGGETVIMYVGAGPVTDGAIVSNSTLADAVTINIGSNNGLNTLLDIAVGNGGGIAVNVAGGTSSLTVGATGLINAPGSGAVTISSEGSVDVSGTIDAGTGLIDIEANTDNTGAQIFTMGADGRLTTDSTAANSVSVFVGATTGSNTVREIETTGGVEFDVDGDGTITFSNDGSGNGITASGAGNVIINTEGAAVFNGLINSGSGIIDVDANSDGSGAQSITIGGVADIRTTNSGASAIHLQVNSTSVGTTDEGDINVISTAGMVTVGNGGTITLSSISGTTVGDARVEFGNGAAGQSVTFNAGVDGAILIEAEDYALIRQGMTANVTGGSTLTIKGNQDGVGTEFFQMYTGGLGGNIVSDSTKSDAVNIEVNTTGGGTAVANVRNITVGNGGGINVVNHGSTITTEAGTALTATNGTVELRATNLTLDGTVSAVGGTVTIDRSVAGTIGVFGATAFGDMQISQAEVNRISAATLNIGDAVAADNNATLVRVNAVSTTAGITGVTRINALDAAGSDVEILGANSFRSLEGNANDLIDLQGATSVTTTTGGASFNADVDDSGVGNFQSAAGSSVNTSAGNGNVTINAADFSLAATSAINSGSGNISFLPSSTGRTVELGGSGLGLNVTLTDAEFDTLTSTGTVFVGDSSTGNVTISAGISPAGAGNLFITSSGTVLDASSAANDFSGTSLTIDGNFESATTPAFGVFNLIGSFTLSNNNTVVVDIQGNATPVAGTHYDQISTTGAVTIGSNVILDLNQSGTKPPVGATYTLINNGSGSAVTGLFIDAQTNTVLNEGDWIDQGLVLYTISYMGGDGNDVVLTSLGPVETAATIDVNGNLVIDDIENTSTNDTLTFSVVGSNLRITDPNVIVGFDGIPSAVRISPNSIDIPLTAFTGIIVNTGGGDDSVTISALGTIDGQLTVDGGTGTDSITQSGDVTLVADSNATYTAETITLGTGADLALSGTGAVTFTAGRRIHMQLNSSIVTGSGDVTMTANLAGAETGNFAGIHLKGADVTSTTGDVSLTGSGGTSGNYNKGIAIDFDYTSGTSSDIVTGGSVILNGTGGAGGQQGTGVSIDRATVRSTGAGPVTITGTGGAGIQFNEGVTIFFSAVDAGTGDLAITGTGSSAGSFNRGISAGASSFTSLGGNISMLGTGGGALTATSSVGTELTGTTVTTIGAGTIVLAGTGANGTANNAGLRLTGAGTVSAVNGLISLAGTGQGSTVSNMGLQILAATQVLSTGTGGINIDGTGSTTGTIGNYGVEIASDSIIRVATGDLTVDGTGNGTLEAGKGVVLGNALMESTGTGNIVINGSGSSNTSTGASPGIEGVGARIRTTGTGDITLIGTGGTGASWNSGVVLSGASSVTTVSGDLLIQGNGGGSGSGSVGVLVNASTTLSVGGSGSLTIDGTSALGTDSNEGVQIASSSVVSSVDGDLTITGTGRGTGQLISGVLLSNATVSTTGLGNVIITGGSTSNPATGSSNKGISMSGGSVNSVSGNITLVGTGGRGANSNDGIRLVSAILRSTSGGAIGLTGTALGSTTGTANIGANLSDVTLHSSGAITVTGVGGGATSANHGVYMQSIIAPLSTPTANGTAGTGSGSLATTGNFFP
jgi:hypothetical protein